MDKAVLEKIRKQYSGYRSGNQNKFDRLVWIREGKTFVRFLPKPEAQNLPYVVGGVHFSGVPRPERCPRLCTSHLAKPLPCPICEFAAKLADSDDQTDKDLVKTLWPVRRFYWQALVRKSIGPDGRREVPDKKPMVLELGIRLWEEIVGFYFSESEAVDLSDVDPSDILEFDDPYEGHDVILKRWRTSQGAWMSKAELVIKSSPLDEDESEIQRILSEQVNLDEYVPSLCRSYDAIEALMSGKEADFKEPETEDLDEEDEVFDEVTSSKKEEDFEEPEEEEDEEDEPVVKKSSVVPRHSSGEKKPDKEELRQLIREQLKKRGK